MGDVPACRVRYGALVTFGDAATGNRVLRNFIFENGTLGIELKNDGVTPNDQKDRDAGPNLVQNIPVVNIATSTQIEGTFKSRSRRTFPIQHFSNPAPNAPTGFGEGKTFIGEKFVTTNRRGKASFTAPFSAGHGRDGHRLARQHLRVLAGSVRGVETARLWI